MPVIDNVTGEFLTDVLTGPKVTVSPSVVAMLAAVELSESVSLILAPPLPALSSCGLVKVTVIDIVSEILRSFLRIVD